MCVRVSLTRILLGLGRNDGQEEWVTESVNLIPCGSTWESKFPPALLFEVKKAISDGGNGSSEPDRLAVNPMD